MSTAVLSTCPPRGDAQPRHARPRPEGRRRSAVVLALLLGGTGLVGSGVLSAWQATSDVSTGALSAADGAVQILNANGSTFISGVPDLLPGDYFYRYVDLRNPGTSASPFAGELSATGDLKGSLLAQAESCPTAWVGGTCAAPTVLAAERALTTPLPVSYGSIDPGVAGTKHVRYRFTFADDAAPSLMGKTGSISASVSSTLIGGRNRTGS